ncbi:MAG: hypothetical protein SFV23_17580 [Planctomycetaceae bacterium]|nr:hypothetical protein [Planctomycetaceae bacterium]
MSDPRALKRWSADFMSYVDDQAIITPQGKQLRRDALADFQRARFRDLAVDLQAIVRGEKPPIGRHWWEGTKGCSKDTDLALAMDWPLIFGPRPLRMQAGAADQDQAGELRRAVKSEHATNPWRTAYVNAQANKVVNGKTGSELEIIAADVAGSHGARPDILIINELTHIPDGRKEFAENLMDNATKVPNGIVIIATNAGFLDSWQWQWRETARKSDRWAFHQYSQPAPWLTASDIDEARQRNSESRFSRLWCGEWVSLTERPLLTRENVERAVSDSCLWPGGERPETLRNCELYVGVDIGRTQDRTVVWTLQKLGDKAVTRDVHVMRNVPFADQKREISRRITRDVVKCFVDKGAIGMQLAEELESAFPGRCEGIQLTSGRQGQIGALVKSMFDRGLVTIPDDPQIKVDLQMVDAAETINGIPQIKTNRGPTGHADRFWALALAMHAMPIQRPQNGSFRPRYGGMAGFTPSAAASRIGGGMGGIRFGLN